MTATPLIEVIVLDTPSLGDRSYLAHDGEFAVVVDAQRDIDRVRDVIAARELRVTHVPEDSRHTPVHELPARLDEVPPDRQVWVHCAGGYRAAVAASLLRRAGVDVVTVDDRYRSARAAGLPLALAA